MYCLIVDDAQTVRNFLGGILRQIDVDFEEAENGDQGIEHLKRESFDFVISDLNMPILNGIEFSMKIREELKLDIPILMLSTEQGESDIEQSIEAGVSFFLPKPPDKEKIKEIVKIFRNIR